MGDDEALAHVGVFAQLARIKLLDAHPALDVEFAGGLAVEGLEFGTQDAEHLVFLFLHQGHLALAVVQDHLEGFDLTLAVHFDAHLVAGAMAGDDFLQLGRGGDFAAVHLDDDVAGLDAGGSGGAVFQQAVHVGAGGHGQVFFFGQVAVNGANHDAQHSALHHAVLQQVFHHLADDVAGHGEAIACIDAGGAGNGGVDADEPTLEIDQRTPAVAGVDGGVRLDEALHRELLAQDVDVARLGADDTRRDGGVQPHGVANGQHPFAHLHLVGVHQGQGGQVFGFDLDEGEVGARVGAHHGGFEGAVVVQGHFDVVGIGDDVVVGHDVAVLADDDTGARSDAHLRAALAFGALEAEEGLEEIVVEEVAEGIGHAPTEFEILRLFLPPAEGLGGLDVHHGVDHLLGGAGEVQGNEISFVVQGVNHTLGRGGVDVFDANGLAATLQQAVNAQGSSRNRQRYQGGQQQGLFHGLCVFELGFRCGFSLHPFDFRAEWQRVRSPPAR